MSAQDGALSTQTAPAPAPLTVPLILAAPSLAVLAPAAAWWSRWSFDAVGKIRVETYGTMNPTDGGDPIVFSLHGWLAGGLGVLAGVALIAVSIGLIAMTLRRASVQLPVPTAVVSHLARVLAAALGATVVSAALTVVGLAQAVLFWLANYDEITALAGDDGPSAPMSELMPTPGEWLHTQPWAPVAVAAGCVAIVGLGAVVVAAMRARASMKGSSSQANLPFVLAGPRRP